MNDYTNQVLGQAAGSNSRVSSCGEPWSYGWEPYMENGKKNGKKQKKKKKIKKLMRRVRELELQQQQFGQLLAALAYQSQNLPREPQQPSLWRKSFAESVPKVLDLVTAAMNRPSAKPRPVAYLTDGRDRK